MRTSEDIRGHDIGSRDIGSHDIGGRGAAGRWIGRTAAVVLATALLASCGYDVELNGKVFDALGIGSNSKKTESEPKLAVRSGLVPPPDLSRLPPPGSGGRGTGQASWPVDPEVRAAAIKAEQERKQREACNNPSRKAIFNPREEWDTTCGSALNRSINKALQTQHRQFNRQGSGNSSGANSQ